MVLGGMLCPALAVVEAATQPYANISKARACCCHNLMCYAVSPSCIPQLWTVSVGTLPPAMRVWGRTMLWTTYL